MSHFFNSPSCFPSWMPLWLPCQVVYLLIYIIASALIFDVIVYGIFPRFGWFSKIKTLNLLIENPRQYQIGMFHSMVLSVKNTDGENKIVDLHATSVYIDQFHLQDEEVVSSGHDIEESFLWTNGTKTTDLMPKAKDGLLTAALGSEPSRAIHFGGLPVQGVGFGFCTAFFEKESIFKYQILFQGRYTKEQEYRKFIYTDVIYSSPMMGRLVSGHDALQTYSRNMPRQFINKIEQLQEEIKKEVKNEEKTTKKDNLS